MLEFKGGLLVEADGDEDAEQIGAGVNQLLCQRLAEREDGVKNLGCLAGYLVKGQWGEHFGHERIFGRGIVDDCQVEISKGDFDSVDGLVLFCQVRGHCCMVAGAEDVDSPSKGERVVCSCCTVARRLASQDVSAVVVGIDFDLFQGLQVARKVGQVVPAHGVDVCLGDLLGKDRM